MSKKLSPFSKEFWIEKGYTEKEAEIKRNSLRPIRKEYWMKKGFSEEQSIKKALETKEQNNKKGAKASASRLPEKIKIKSPRCIEYWLAKGYDEEEAKVKRKEAQSLGRLDKWIERHGKILGEKLWKQRQDKWLKTMYSKPKNEKKSINKKKNSFSYQKFIQNGFKNEDIAKELKKLRNIDLVLDIESFIKKIKNDIKNNPCLKYQKPLKFSRKYQKIQYEILGIKNPKKFVEQFLESDKIFEVLRGKSYGYRLHTEEGLLRSSLEIEFYKLCKEYKIDFLLDKNYPNSNFRYDFYLPKENKYIEICPNYDKKHNEKYTEKINKKKKLFNCLIIKNMKEIQSFFEEIVIDESDYKKYC